MNWCNTRLKRTNKYSLNDSNSSLTADTDLAVLLWISLSFCWIWLFSSMTIWANCVCTKCANTHSHKCNQQKVTPKFRTLFGSRLDWIHTADVVVSLVDWLDPVFVFSFFLNFRSSKCGFWMNFYDNCRICNRHRCVMMSCDYFVSSAVNDTHLLKDYGVPNTRITANATDTCH